MCKSTIKWNMIIEAVEAAPFPLQKAALVQQSIGNGENAWQVSEELWMFIGDFIGDTLFNNRLQMVGGKAEEFNGFEFWRALYHEDVG